MYAYMYMYYVGTRYGQLNFNKLNSTEIMKTDIVFDGKFYARSGRTCSCDVAAVADLTVVKMPTGPLTYI